MERVGTGTFLQSFPVRRKRQHNRTGVKGCIEMIRLLRSLYQVMEAWR